MILFLYICKDSQLFKILRTFFCTNILLFLFKQNKMGRVFQYQNVITVKLPLVNNVKRMLDVLIIPDVSLKLCVTISIHDIIYAIIKGNSYSYIFLKLIFFSFKINVLFFRIGKSDFTGYYMETDDMTQHVLFMIWQPFKFSSHDFLLL